MGHTMSCLNDGRAPSQAKRADTFYRKPSSSSLRSTKLALSAKAISSSSSSSSTAAPLHKASFSDAAHTTVTHSTHASFSLVNSYDALRLHSASSEPALDKDTWDAEDGMRTTQPLTSVSSSASSSLAASPRHRAVLHTVITSTAVAQLSHITPATAARRLAVAASPPSSTRRVEAVKEVEETKEEVRVVDPRDGHHRGFSDSSAIVRPVQQREDGHRSTTNPAVTEVGARSPYVDRQAKVVRAVIPSPQHSRANTVVDHETARVQASTTNHLLPSTSPAASATTPSPSSSPSASPPRGRRPSRAARWRSLRRCI